MAVWFNTLRLTTRCLLPLRACPDGGVVLCIATDCSQALTTAPFVIPFGGCDKVASDLGLHLQLASHEFYHNMAAKITKKIQTS